MRMDRIRSSIQSAQSQSEALAEHVAEMTQLVDGAASRHAEWETKLASMVESDTRRSAEVAQKQETLAAALGIRPRANSSPVWRVIQHVLFFIGLIFSVVFVSPLSALKRWNEKRGVGQGSRLSAVVRPGRRGQLSGDGAQSHGIQVGTQNYGENDGSPTAHSASTELSGAESRASKASRSRARTDTLPDCGRTSNGESGLTEQGLEDPKATVTTITSAPRRPLSSERRVDSPKTRSTEPKDGNSARPDLRRSELLGTPRRRLSWADRSSLLGINVEYKSDDGAETDFWNTFDA